MNGKNNWLNDYKKNIYSQRGEDGILEKIFEVLDTKKGICVDIGAFGKALSNTYHLIENGWEGFLFEKDADKVEDLKYIHKGNNVHCICETVDIQGSRRLDNLLFVNDLPKKFDFLSIDIDGLDYDVWRSLTNYEPSVVVIEFNPTYGFDDYLQTIDGEGGASLSKMIELGKLKFYELIATTNFNAFFVRKDLFNKFEINNNSIQELFVENNDSYGEKTKI